MIMCLDKQINIRDIRYSINICTGICFYHKRKRSCMITEYGVYQNS